MRHVLRFVFTTADLQARDLTIDYDSEAKLIDLSDAVRGAFGEGAAPSTWKLVEGTRVLELEKRILETGLLRGTHIRVSPSIGQGVLPSLDGSLVCLSVVGGPDSGGTFDIGTGEVIVGRAGTVKPVHDPALSREHFAIRRVNQQLVLRDLNSPNGTAINGVRVVGGSEVSMDEDSLIEAGNSLFLCLRRTTSDRLIALPDANGLVSISRRPRFAQTTPAKQYAYIPQPSRDNLRRRRTQAALGSAVMGLPMIGASAITGNKVFAAAGAASLLVGAGIRATGITSGGLSPQELRGQRASLLRSIAEDRKAAEGQLWASVPSLPVLLATARNEDSVLWSRSMRDSDALLVSVGWGDATSPNSFKVSGTSGETPDAELVDALALRTVPKCVDLTGTALALAGTRQFGIQVANSLAIQLLTLRSPVDLEVFAVLPDTPSDFDWIEWAPHFRSPFSGRSRVAKGQTEGEALLRLVSGAMKLRKDSPDHDIVVFIDAESKCRSAAINELMAQCASSNVSIVWFGGTPTDAPTNVTAMLSVDGVRGSAILQRQGAADETFPFTALATNLAKQAVVDLAPLRDPAEVSPGPVASGSSNLLGLFGPLSADAVRSEWEKNTDTCRAPVGVANDNILWIDLERDGPHALIAGTTGSGKSEFLQTLVASFSIRHSPETLNFILIDYKGGSAFRDVISFPHVVGIVTDLDQALVERALISLRAELKFREHAINKHGCRDLAELRVRFPADAPARLVIVIDEFAALKRELPEFVDGIVDIAQRGRSLGVHLLLATQRPGGVVSENIKANTNLRVALRLNDAMDSREVIGTGDAANISPSSVGGAIMRGFVGATAFQSAYSGGPVIRREPVVIVGASLANETSTVTEAAYVSDLLLEAFNGMLPPRRPWCDPLPKSITLDELRVLTGDKDLAGKVLIGLRDVPEEQRQEPAVWDWEKENLLILGARGEGQIELLGSILAQLDSTKTVVIRPSELFGFSPAGPLVSSLEDLELLVQKLEAGDGSVRWVIADGLDRLKKRIDEARAIGLWERLMSVFDRAASPIACVALSANRAVPSITHLHHFTDRVVFAYASAEEAILAGTRRANADDLGSPNAALDRHGFRIISPAPVEGPESNRAISDRSGNSPVD